MARPGFGHDEPGRGYGATTIADRATALLGDSVNYGDKFTINHATFVLADAPDRRTLAFRAVAGPQFTQPEPDEEGGTSRQKTSDVVPQHGTARKASSSLSLEQFFRRLEEAEDQARIAEERAPIIEARLKKSEQRAEVAEERAQTTESQLKGAEERAGTAEKQIATAAIRAHLAEQRVEKAESRAQTIGKRLEEAENRAQKAELRIQAAEKRTEAATNLTRRAEEQARKIQAQCSEAEDRARKAEERNEDADNRAQEAEKRLQDAERVAEHTVADARSAHKQAQLAEKRAQAAEKHTQEAGEGLKEAQQELTRLKTDYAAAAERSRQAETQLAEQHLKLDEVSAGKTSAKDNGYAHDQQPPQSNDAYYQDGYYDDQYYDQRNGQADHGSQGYYDESGYYNSDSSNPYKHDGGSYEDIRDTKQATTIVANQVAPQKLLTASWPVDLSSTIPTHAIEASKQFHARVEATMLWYDPAIKHCGVNPKDVELSHPLQRAQEIADYAYKIQAGLVRDVSGSMHSTEGMKGFAQRIHEGLSYYDRHGDRSKEPKLYQYLGRLGNACIRDLLSALDEWEFTNKISVLRSPPNLGFMGVHFDINGQIVNGEGDVLPGGDNESSRVKVKGASSRLHRGAGRYFYIDHQTCICTWYPLSPTHDSKSIPSKLRRMLNR